MKKLQLADTMGLRFDGPCMLDIQRTTKEGVPVYPYLCEKEGAPGIPVFDVSLSGNSDEYEGVDLPGLLRLFKDGAFNRKAQIRMKPLTGGHRSGKAPELGTISAHFRSLVAALDAPQPPKVTSSTSTPRDADQGRSAIDDLSSFEEESSGDRALTVRHEYLRDPQERKKVIDFAKGHC